MAKITQTEAKDQLEKLRKWFPRGSTVYTILRHVSRSGMQRQISVVCISADSDGKITDLHPNWSISQLVGYRLNKGGAHDTLIVNGCGMDMGFDIAYNLSAKLYGDGYALNHRWL